MKKLCTGIILFVLIAACFTGCGNNAKTSNTLNITEANYLTLISDIYKNPADYTGRTIKIEGLFAADNHGSHSHYYVYRNAPVYDPDHGHDHIQEIGFELAYNGVLPKDNDWIEVVGVLRTYTENGNTLLTLDTNSVIVSSKRGAETIGGTESIIAPDCVSMGYTVYTCVFCDDTYTGSYTDPTGHSYAAEVIPPNCTELGFSVFTCDICDYTYTGDFVVSFKHKDDMRHVWEFIEVNTEKQRKAG